MADDGGRAARFAALQKKFVERTRGERGRLAELRAALSKADGRGETLAALRFLCHSLHGTAGTFGHPAIGDAAARVEALSDGVLAAALDADIALPPELGEATDVLIALIDGIGHSR